MANLCGTSIAYGLTEGGYNANEITLSGLGRRIVAPVTEGDDARARREAIMKPRIMREFFTRYDRKNFPPDAIAQNVLVSLGLPKERAAGALTVLTENGTSTGIIRQTKSGLFVALDSPAPAARVPDPNDSPDKGTDDHEDGDTPPPVPKSERHTGGSTTVLRQEENNRVSSRTEGTVGSSINSRSFLHSVSSSRSCPSRKIRSRSPFPRRCCRTCVRAQRR